MMNDNRVAVIYHFGYIASDTDDFYQVLVSKSKTGSYFGDGDDLESLTEGTEEHCVQYCKDNNLDYTIAH